MPDITVISCNYNGNVFVRNNILSVYSQTYKPKNHYFIDDISTDNCVDIVKKTIFDNNIKNIKLIENEEKAYKIKNLFNIIHNEIDDDDIVVIIDGDDWLPSNNIFEKINNIYRQKNCKYMYSNFVFSHNLQPGISRRIPGDQWDPYKDNWITSHISTFKASEFKKINYKNFVDNEGNWFKMGCDQAYVLPILENIKRTGSLTNDVYFNNEIMYVYHHTGNPSKPRDGTLGRIALDAVQTIRERRYVK